MKMKRIGRLTLVFMLSVLLAVSSGCSKSPEQLIDGEWIDDYGNTIEFHQDGTMTGSILSENPIPGTYTWLDETHIEMTCSGADLEEVYINVPVSMEAEIINLSQDMLEFVVQGNSFSFRRVGR